MVAEVQLDEKRVVADRIVTTVCSYCGVGCNLELHVKDDFIFKVTSPLILTLPVILEEYTANWGREKGGGVSVGGGGELTVNPSARVKAPTPVETVTS